MFFASFCVLSCCILGVGVSGQAIRSGLLCLNLLLIGTVFSYRYGKRPAVTAVRAVSNQSVIPNSA
jgi:hypothetical protein